MGQTQEVAVLEHEFAVASRQRAELVDVTAEVQRAVAQSGVRRGLCVVYCPHTTAGITVNEHADPDVVRDLLLWLSRAVPRDAPGFRHGEGNSDSHIQAALVGCSATLLVEDGRLALGTWQGVFLCEFDGPRRRRCWVRVLEGGA
jgi:secondary thiamine-phosphate synthase enzyme